MDIEKTCSKCHQPKPLDAFYRHPQTEDKHFACCKECTKANVRANYQAAGGRPEYEREREKRPERKAQKLAAMRKHRTNNPLKYKARNAVNNAIRDKRLVRLPCKVCGATRVQAHHHDYSKPLDVEWLCFQHHREDEHEQTVRSPDTSAPAVSAP